MIKTLTSLVPVSAFIRGQKINSHNIQQCLVKIFALFSKGFDERLQIGAMKNMPQRVMIYRETKRLTKTVRYREDTG